ncbi:MAG: TonB-dependent receptor [Phycisphaerae bacterium]|nr:TonB-dependent receptor [Saprospiraceae bacterium]
MFSQTFISKSLGYFFFLIFALIVGAANAQRPDSSQHHLPEVTIRDVRFVRTGYAFWTADSLPNNGTLSLSERLLWENALDVRANAPGTLATLSIRGMGSSRTPVFWNGLNLQSPMHGVVDASLLPLWPDDQLEVHYGGQSAAQSSGAMGGSVVITQGQQRFEEGFSGFITGAAGSFGQWDGSAGAGFSNEKFASKIRANWQRADNDFSFQKQGLDGMFYQARQVNNYLEKTDLQQFNQFKFSKKNTLKTAFWFQNAFREIPPTTTESTQEKWQRDRAHRTLLTWENAPNTRIFWTTRAAWLDDYLAFHTTGDTDTSHSRQALLSTERSASIGKKWAWRLGSTALRQWAQVDGYSDSTRWFGQTRLAGYAMGEWKKGDARFSALFRQEWAEAQAAPFTGSLGGQIGLGRVGETKFHFSRNFNLPTLNDRFWDKLGNPDLRPETGYSADLAWGLHRPKFSLELTGFQLVLDDWILWQPGDSTELYRPGNLRKVWGRGVEGSGHWSFVISHWKFQTSGRIQFSKTTNVAVYGGSESVLGKQLPYTPRVSGGLTLRASRGVFSAAYLQQFTGERFDNGGKTIAAFSIGNLLTSCALLKRRLKIDFRLENLWNTRYEIFRYRPMPGRSWRVGLGYNW